MNEYVVSAENIGFGYAGRRLFSHLDFSLRDGERCLIAGENGSGKTSLLKILLGLIQAESGSVKVFGNEVGGTAWLKKRSRAAYVNQETVRSDFPVSAGEAVEIGTIPRRIPREARRQEVNGAMELTGCWHLRKRSYGTLSGGEKQRVSLARCLAQKAELLLLDEPTSSLDPDSSKSLIELIESLAVSIVMITHDETLLDRTGWRVLHLKNGLLKSDRNA